MLKNSLFRRAVQKCSDARRAKTSRVRRIIEIRRTMRFTAQLEQMSVFLQPVNGMQKLSVSLTGIFIS